MAKTENQNIERSKKERKQTNEWEKGREWSRKFNVCM